MHIGRRQGVTVRRLDMVVLVHEQLQCLLQRVLGSPTGLFPGKMDGVDRQCGASYPRDERAEPEH